MTAEQAIVNFWENFEIPAYDENSVPEGASFPYITYSISTAGFGDEVASTASLWYRTSSWADITIKANQISEYIGMGGKVVSFDFGALWAKRGVPFTNRMGDPDDDLIRRVILNVNFEFLTNV